MVEGWGRGEVGFKKQVKKHMKMEKNGVLKEEGIVEVQRKFFNLFPTLFLCERNYF